MWFTPTRDTYVDQISIVLVLILALMSVLSGVWLAIPSTAIAFCWIMVARIRADSISIQQDTIEIQQRIIDAQRKTMDRMLGPYAQLSEDTIEIQQRIIDAQRQTMDRMLGPYAQLSGPGEGPS